MFTFPSLRKRITAQPVVGGGMMGYIMQAPQGSPNAQLSAPYSVGQQRGYYHFHEGDLFTPGTGNWVLDPVYETPLMCVWGNGSLITKPNFFNPLQPPQIYPNMVFRTVGLGGLQTGQMMLAPLMSTQPTQGEFVAPIAG